MTRDSSPDPEDADPESDPESSPQPGTVRTTGPATLVPIGLIALILGWSVRPVSIRIDRIAPAVTGLSIAVIFFMTAVVAGSAYFTWRTLHREGRRIPAHHAVNRLVLGKACAVVGVVLSGGYAGNAIAHLGASEADANTQLWLSLAAATGGLTLMVSALLLEYACRVRRDKD